MPKLTSKRPALATEDEFIAGAEKSAPKVEAKKPKPVKSAYPWDAPSVRSDVTKIKNIRLPEAYLMKLKFIAENSPKSAEAFIRDALMPAIDKEIAKLTAK
jgi:hypothetical protein